MSSTVLKHIKAKDIPESWKKNLEAEDPEETFNITIEPERESEEKDSGKPEKGKWAKVAEKMAKEAFLKGRSEEVINLGREFRDNF